MTATIAPATGITERDALTPLGLHCARTLAAASLRSAKGKVTEAAAKIERLFSGCEEAGYGFPDECTATVLSELAAMAGAP